MWQNNDEKEVNALMDAVDKQIADLTEACEPILTWDGVCGLVQVKDEDYVMGVQPPEVQKNTPGQKREGPKS